MNIIGTSLLFSHGSLITPVLVVATRGGVDDWAAYAAGVSLSQVRAGDVEPSNLGGSAIAQHVAAYGFKLSEATARAFFPHVEGEYRP